MQIYGGLEAENFDTEKANKEFDEAKKSIEKDV